MKKLLFLIGLAFTVLIAFNCASTSKSKHDDRPWLWKSEPIQFSDTDSLIITAKPHVIDFNVLNLRLNIWNKSDESIEIEDIIIKDRNELMLHPLSPAGLAYALLGSPPANFPILPSYSSSKKKFIVTGHIREFPEGYYTGDFEIEEHESALDSYLQGYALGRAIGQARYKKNFEAIVVIANDAGFKTDIVPAHTQITGILYYKKVLDYYPPYALEIYLKNSRQHFSYKFKIRP